MKTCHYDLLEVGRTATDADIKKAYRRKALQLHPDKNPDRIEEATRLFAEVQQAYEVLSDPHERAWYDSHREAILRGLDHTHHEHAAGAQGGSSRFYGGTDVEDLMRFFSASAYSSLFDDSLPTNVSFYSVYSKLFNQLHDEELEAYRNPDVDSNMTDIDEPEPTRFGDSRTEFIPIIKEFYDRFCNFSTLKSYRWHDKYRLSDAPDRRIRRLMEKENKKLRDVAKREFNDCVRNLADFVKKRDPRVKEYMKQQQIEQEKRVQEHKEALMLAKLAKKEMRERYVEPEWAKAPSFVNSEEEEAGSDDDDIENDQEEVEEEEEDIYARNLDQNEDDGAFSSQEEDEEDTDELYCVACNKVFKSDRQRQDHDRSKKHLKSIELLRHQMLQEEMELAAANNEDEEGEEDLVVKDKTKVGENDNNVDNEILPHPPIEVKSKRKNKKKNTYGIVTDDEIHVPSSLKPVISTDEEDVDWSTGGKSNKRKGGGGGKKSLAKDKRSFKLSSSSTSQQSTTDNNDSQLTADADGAVDNLTEVMVGSKISLDTDDQNNKKKGESTSDHVCNVCKSGFPSRSKLFDHINATGHALAESLSQIGGGGKRGKRK